MATEFHFYEPRHGHGLPHNPFYAIMGPRLIGWIATRSQGGVDNIAPYSFFGAYSVEPPIIGFSSEGWKDTVENVKKTGEFTWSLVSRNLAEVMNHTSAPVAPEVDEFSMAGIQKGDCRIVSAKRVEGSPVSFECHLSDLIRLKSSTGGALDRWLVLGEVVGVHIRSDLLINGVYQTAKAEPILRAGGKSDYFGISDKDRFEMIRPR